MMMKVNQESGCVTAALVARAYHSIRSLQAHMSLLYEVDTWLCQILYFLTVNPHDAD